MLQWGKKNSPIKRTERWCRLWTHLAIPPCLERDQPSLLAEQRSHVNSGLAKNTGKRRKTEKSYLNILWQSGGVLWGGCLSVLPWPRNTRSSASNEMGMPVDFSSSTKASLRVGGNTAPLFRMAWNKNQCVIGNCVSAVQWRYADQYQVTLTVAGVLCCRLAPNVLSNHSFRPGMSKPLNLYLYLKR